MDNSIRNLFKTLKQNPEFMRGINRETEKEVRKILKEKYENKEELALLLASVGEESGFVEGVKYAVRLMSECYTDGSVQNLDNL